MILHNLTQGTPEWHAYRLEHFGASEAAAMLGLSKKVTRSELLHAKHTGIAKEFDEWIQKNILDHGHEVEALARPIIEELISDDLYPVTCSLGKLSASCDGLTMAGDVAFEHKQWNMALAASVADCVLPDEHMPQCQQIMMVTKAKCVIFVVSDGTRENMVHMRVLPNAEWQQRIALGWEQFEKDLAEYVPPEVIVPAVAAPQMGLPAVSINVTGSIALVDNLDKFGTALTAYVERINKKPETDQDFADLEATVKTLKTAEDALDAAEAGALAQTDSIDTMRKTVALYRETARTNRLLIEKLVKAEKENRRGAIVREAYEKLDAHIKSLNVRLGENFMPAIASDFQGVIKGLKSLDSMKDKVDSELARCKIEANAVADRIQANLATLRELASEHAFLFADMPQLVLKANDDLVALVKSRIADHRAAEAAKEETTRERIRAEEQAKAEAAARAAAAPEADLRSETAPAPQAPQLTLDTMAEALNIVPLTSIMAAPTTPPTLKLGTIAERLGFTLTADFLLSLGFKPAATDKAAKLYHESDFGPICFELYRHIQRKAKHHAANQ